MTARDEGGAATAASLDQAGTLPALLGIEWLDLGQGSARGRIEIAPHHLAPTGYLHAATVVALADTACGYGCLQCLPDGVSGFATAELTANFIGTATTGTLVCEAELAHTGRTTQVWDATGTSEDHQRRIALFRCTQILLTTHRPGDQRRD